MFLYRKYLLSMLIFFTSPSLCFASDWELIWADEFEYNGLPNSKNWNYEKGFIRNHELQYYTHERKENVWVENGVLTITAQKETFPNSSYKANTSLWKTQRKTAQYTSVSIQTLGALELKYGRVEVRAKLPSGRGVWPAIWMLGVNRRELGWPICGEIDIMEYVGHKPSTIHSRVHFADPNVSDEVIHKSAGHGEIQIDAPDQEFHVYSIDWDEHEIQFFVDGKQYGTFDIKEAGDTSDNPFHKPFYLLINLAIGGSWGGKVDNSIFPQKYQIDYVRVYKHRSR